MIGKKAMRAGAVALAGLSIVLAGCAAKGSAKEADAPVKKPKNVILFIGDGMGNDIVDAAGFVQDGQGLDANGEPPRLFFETFPVAARLAVFSADSFVTDSAASATAYACGVKTYNAAIGVDNDKKPVESLAEIAKKNGKSVGILSSVSVNHATPGSFYAHVDFRDKYDEIVQQLFDANSVDVALGGGISGKLFALDRAKAECEKRGIAFYTVENYADLTPESAGARRVIGAFDTNDNKQLDYMVNRAAKPTAEPVLSDMTLRALRILEPRDGGFFMMVEGGAIDWAGHSNMFNEAIGETLEFDKTIEATVNYLRERGELDDTLIVVTADHETGGLTMIGPYDKPYSAENPIEASWSTKKHAGAAVPMHARGPMSELLGGKRDQTLVFRVMKDAMTAK